MRDIKGTRYTYHPKQMSERAGDIKFHEGMATLSSILVWEIPWTEEPGGLQSIGSQRVEHNWSDLAHMHAYNFIKAELCISIHAVEKEIICQNLCAYICVCVYIYIYIYIHTHTQLYNFTVILSLFTVILSLFTVNSEVTVSLITTPGSNLFFFSWLGTWSICCCSLVAK